MAFSFGFSGDDIDLDLDDAENIHKATDGTGEHVGGEAPVTGEKVKRHSFDEAVSLLVCWCLVSVIGLFFIYFCPSHN
jgi:hypothetical protein